jgi:hypothetical protein
MSRISFFMALLLAVGCTHSLRAVAETPSQIQAGIEAAAKAAPGFKGFSAASGEQFFKSSHGGEYSCASCHTEDPAGKGKHAKTNKVIEPLAPSANAERFTDPAKVEKWFKRNCNDVLSRACTAQEKGDVLAWLLTVKK